jgi:hypothetical protein
MPNPIPETADLPPRQLRCEVIAVRIGNEQRRYIHAMERGNEVRAERGLPPVTIDEQGGVHVVQ